MDADFSLLIALLNISNIGIEAVLLTSCLFLLIDKNLFTEELQVSISLMPALKGPNLLKNVEAKAYWIMLFYYKKFVAW